MVRETSREVLRQIEDEGLLSEKRARVYKALFKHGPCTANELYRKSDLKVKTTQANIHPRLGELRSMGVVTEVSERKCLITNRTAIVWDVTKKLPKDFKHSSKHLTKREMLRRYTAATNYALKVFKSRGKNHFDEMMRILEGE